jgi:hypothetical protein
MRRTRKVFGYIWAVVCTIIAVVTFMQRPYFASALATKSGVTISPRFSGGETRWIVAHAGYRTLIHRPVFDGLFSEREKGFVQVNWEPRTGLPRMITEEIDYDGDGRADFRIMLDTITGGSSLRAYDVSVISVDRSYRLSNGWAVRILLSKRS